MEMENKKIFKWKIGKEVLKFIVAWNSAFVGKMAQTRTFQSYG